MKPQRYVAYYRVSTQKQGRSGLGLDAQKLAVNDYLSQYGGEIIAEFTEIESGKLASRKEFSNAAVHAELSNAVLLVAKLDRLSRDIHFVTDLQRRGIKFVLADMPAVDTLTVHVLAVMASHEARLCSTRTKAALAQARQRGVTLGNPWLAVYRNGDLSAANAARSVRSQAWHQKIQKIIQHVEDSEGLTTCQAIADALNERGLRTIRGAEFSVPIVSRIRRSQPYLTSSDS